MTRRYRHGIIILAFIIILLFSLSYHSPRSVQSPGLPQTQPVLAVAKPPGPEKVTATVYSLTDTKVYDIPGGQCTIYPDCPTGRLSVATIIQKGRYPEEGQRVNATCTEAILVLEGELVVTIGSDAHRLQAGSLVYVTPGTPYSVEGTAKAVVCIEPKWDKTQNTPSK